MGCFQAWELERNSSYNQAKTEAMFMDRDNKNIRPPVIRPQHGAPAVELSDKLKYLGLLFDSKGNFATQIKLVRTKTAQLANKIINAAKKTYGRKSVL